MSKKGRTEIERKGGKKKTQEKSTQVQEVRKETKKKKSRGATQCASYRSMNRNQTHERKKKNSSQQQQNKKRDTKKAPLSLYKIKRKKKKNVLRIR